MVTFENFPLKRDFGRFEITDVVLYRDIDRLITLANKYRNLFRHNFLSSEVCSVEQTKQYFESYRHNRDTKIMYAVSVSSELVAHYGLKRFSADHVLLDNAMRFTTKGGRELLAIVQNELITLVRSLISPDVSICLVVKKNNFSALRLHNQYNLQEFGDDEYGIFELDRSRFLGARLLA